MRNESDDWPIDVRTMSRLQWRCRRGLLENDLFVQRFFQRHGARLNQAQARGLGELMALADNDLLDLLLQRREPMPDTMTGEARAVLHMMRVPKHEACAPTEMQTT